MEQRSIEYHYDRGLPRDIHPNGVISIIMGKNSRHSKNIKYWAFELKKDNNM